MKPRENRASAFMHSSWKPWVAGIALQTALGATGPVLVGAAIAALYFLPLTALVLKDRRAERLRVAELHPHGEPVVADL